MFLNANQILYKKDAKSSLVEVSGCLENPWLVTHFALANNGLYRDDLEIDEALAFTVWLADVHFPRE